MDYHEYNKDQLIHFCEKLQRKMTKYENRLSDLVSAYKDLAEEKKLLEESLGAVHQEKKDTFFQKSKAFITKSKQPTAATSQLADPNEAENNSESAEKRFEVLTKAFQSLTEKKSKMEIAFQADKKLLISEHDKTVIRLEDDLARLTIQLEKLKSKLGHEQKERDNDAKLHSTMLAELQNILATERLMNDELKTQLSVEKPKSRATTPDIPRKCLECARRQKTEDVQKIKRDLIEEQKRISEAEVLFQLRQNQDEERISELEQKISKLSSTIGDYEKGRYEDQALIKKLKRKLENHEDTFVQQQNHLARARSGDSFNDDDNNRDTGTGGGNSILDKIRTSSSDEYAKYFDSGKALYSSALDCSSHEMCNCKQEYRKLKLELDNCKSKYMQQQKKNTDTVNSQMAKEYQSQISALKQEKKLLIRNYQEKENNFLDTIHKLEMDRRSAQTSWEQELSQLKQSNVKQIGDLQMELQRQRNRSIDLLSDKDMEIEKLQKLAYDQKDYYHQPFSGSKTTTSAAAVLPTSSIENHILRNEEFEDFLISAPKKEEDSLFHYMEQNSIDRGMSKLRHQVIDLEENNREAEQREAQLLQQMELLKEEIRTLERSKSRESANLEYLKNISLRYILTKSMSQKKQMSVTLSAILKFSPDEAKEVEQRHLAGWW